MSIRVGAVFVALVGLAAWARIGVDNDPQRVLPEQHPFRRDSRTVARAVGGSDAFDVLVPCDSRCADPVELGLFAAAVASEDGVAGPAGPPLHSANGDWLLRFLLAPSGSHAREQLFDAVEARARSLGFPEVRVTGTSVQIARDSGRLIRSTLWGTGTSMLCLFLVFWLGFRSAYYAWLAMVPNVLPCIVIYGGLGAIGRPLVVRDRDDQLGDARPDRRRHDPPAASLPSAAC
jgi:predicted RND superfamily exporter protein